MLPLTASKVMPKSILKKPPARPSPSSSSLSKEEQDRQIAIYHAEIIRQRKDLEFAILNATESLIELPSAATRDPADPSRDDASTVRSLLVHFQPSDYDGLIQERNIEGKCGYVLCPRPRLLQDTEAQFRILRVGRKEGGLKVVPRESLEKWCSEACQRRAMYVRVQLSEEPAWVREATAAEIVFLDEVERKRNAEAGDHQINKLIEEMERSQIGSDESAQKREQLARERGDETGGKERVIVTIKENVGSQNAPVPPSLEDDERLDNSHLLVEGHLTKGQRIVGLRGPLEVGKDLEDDDWDI
ncbi:hypothetical protein GP486_002227 [Trichoglossum hirsutum]|uniref:RNA polymerase II subunit B1 CTD phosphatase RPAP2 homolog n=1 Tax=Trichoglossum hirsutum TaxID=265104 RepID=A0A9P8LFC3_9PEZI|nr:hypothetical protein GP486_002227 [Trichoglossum hirsutum]